MKKIVAIVWLLVVTLTSQVKAQNIAINEDGSSPDASSILDLKSSNKGLLIPRMITTEMSAITTPAKGLLIYNTQTNLLMVNIGTPSVPNWIPVDGPAAAPTVYTFATGTSGSNFNITNSGDDYTFNIPDAGTAARGLVTSSTQTLGGKKTFADSIIANSGVRLNTLASGATTDSLLTISSTGIINKRSISDFVSTTPSNTLTFTQDNFEDFVFDDYAGSGSNDNQFAFTQSASGTGALSEVDGGVALAYSGGNDYVGLHILNTGTTATGKAALGSFNCYDKLKLGGKQVIFEARVRFEALSDATNTYTGYFGITDLAITASTNATGTIAAGAPTNGVYFTYTHGTNSGKWVATNRSAGTSTSINSNVTVVANQFYKVKAAINVGGTQIDYYIDGTLIGSTATNIPTAAMKMVLKLEKTAGTTARTCSTDYVGFRMTR